MGHYTGPRCVIKVWIKFTVTKEPIGMFWKVAIPKTVQTINTWNLDKIPEKRQRRSSSLWNCRQGAYKFTKIWIILHIFSRPLEHQISRIPLTLITSEYVLVNISGLEKLDFLVHESPCSSKQVQENVARLKILFTLWLFEVQVFTSSCSSSCTKWNILWKDESVQ